MTGIEQDAHLKYVGASGDPTSVQLFMVIERLDRLVAFAEKLEPVLDYALRMINKSPGKRIREAMNRHGSGS